MVGGINSWASCMSFPAAGETSNKAAKAREPGRAQQHQLQPSHRPEDSLGSQPSLAHRQPSLPSNTPPTPALGAVIVQHGLGVVEGSGKGRYSLMLFSIRLSGLCDCTRGSSTGPPGSTHQEMETSGYRLGRSRPIPIVT